MFCPTGTRTPAPPDRPGRSQSLYRLSYPGSHSNGVYCRYENKCDASQMYHLFILSFYVSCALHYLIYYVFVMFSINFKDRQITSCRPKVILFNNESRRSKSIQYLSILIYKCMPV
jgi:hypothetical protein